MFRIVEKLITGFFGMVLLDADKALFITGVKKTIIVQAISTILVFACSLFFVKIASVPQYGIYIHVFNWINILMVIGCFGMEDIVLAEIPVLLKTNKQDSIIALLKEVNRVLLLMSLIAAVLFTALAFSGIVQALYRYRYLFMMAMINIYLFAFITVNQQALQAFNRFYESQVADKIIKPLLMLIFIALVWLWYKKADAFILIGCNTLALIAGAIIVFIFLRNTVRHFGTVTTNPFIRTDIIVRGGYFLIISLLFFVKSRIGMLILGSYNDTTGVGIFNITSRLADIVFLPFMLIHAIVPQLFASHVDSDAVYTQKLFAKITGLTTAAAVTITVIIILAGRIILGFYDQTLLKYDHILIILCFGQLLYSLFGPCSAMLMMHGKQKQAAMAALADILVNASFFFILIPIFGLTGAAWGTFAGSLFYNIILRILVNNHFNKR